MSRPQKLNEDVNKIFRDGIAKNLESAIQCTSLSINRSDTTKPSKSSMLATHSDGSIIKSQDQTGLKHKLVSKVKSWSSKDGRGLQNTETSNSTKPSPNPTNIALDLESLRFGSNTLDDSLYKSDLLRARDSLENLAGPPRTIKTVGGNAVANSRLAVVGDSTKVMTWDPWNKLGRTSKKENKFQKRRMEKSPTNSPKNVHSSTADTINTENLDLLDVSESYEYQPYRQKKSVDFLNDVLVVYFTGDEVISRATEPLKKELDQQIRNKEMRRGHVPCTMIGKRQSSGEDYMAAWFKK